MRRQMLRPLIDRWKWWVAAVAGLSAVYTVAGFFLVPLLIKNQVPKVAQAQLARQATIGEVRFNPYTLRLEAHDLRLDEADGAPLFGIGKLTVDLQWRSLIRWAWTLDEVRVLEPSANLSIAKDGKFNVAELLTAFKRQPREVSADTRFPRLILGHFIVEQGRVEFHDRRVGYDDTFLPINLALDNLSTLPEKDGNYVFSADSARGGKLKWKGEVSVNPIHGSGELALADVSLPELAVYLKPYTRASVVNGKIAATLPYSFSYSDGKFDASLAGARLALRDLALARESAKDAFATLLSLDVGAVTANLARHEVTVEAVRAEGGYLTVSRDAKGEIDLAQVLLRTAPPAAPRRSDHGIAGDSWKVDIRNVALSNFGAAVEDQGTGIKVHVQSLAMRLSGVTTDLSRPVEFDGGLFLREGGELSAQGRVVPATGELQSDIWIRQLALAPLQPLLGKYLKLKIARGSVSAHGQLTAGSGKNQGYGLRYVGALDIAALRLNEEDGERFAEWKKLGAAKLTVSLNPNLLQIPELRLVEPNAILIIEEDRSFNAARLLVQRAAGAAAVQAPPQTLSAPATADPFPVHIRRLRVQNGKLDFTDLSLRPQFTARIYELKGVVNGLSTSRDAHSQVELDGRVDDFGLARIRGELNPFTVRDNTDINVVFRNVDMVPATPYTMKFAGYRIAGGRMSLDLQYKIRNSQVEGENQIIFDKLTLGERVESPDALKLPLELAIAILKDDQGRIDLGLPVSGNMDDPQFSYGAIIWKAIVSLLTKIVTAPFRALGKLFGLSGEKLEAIEFDPGSDRLLPPEREKLNEIEQVLAKRTQLKLLVPGQYSETADGAALRARAVRLEIAKLAGIQLEANEEPPPVDIGDRAVRGALRDLYAERFGDAELDRQKKAAEAAASRPGAAGSQTETVQEQLPLWQRLGKMIQGEPKVADASPFYRKLQADLERNQPLAANALSQLGAQRSSAIVAALKEAGVDPTRAVETAPEQVSSEAGKPVPLKLGLAAK